MRSSRSRLVLWGVVLAVALGAGLIVHLRAGPDDTRSNTIAQVSAMPTTAPTTSTTDPPPPGRYQQPPDCAVLNSDSLTFQTTTPLEAEPGFWERRCEATSSSAGAHLRIWVTLLVYTDADGVAGAKSNMVGGEPLSGTDFENPPAMQRYEGDTCIIEYTRSNEFVGIGVDKTGLIDADDCERQALPYAEQFYPLIG